MKALRRFAVSLGLALVLTGCEAVNAPPPASAFYVAIAGTANADILLLDNFTLELLREAVALNAGRAKREASGGVTLENIRAIAETGVDYISTGALTKVINAIDLSMRFV